MPHETSGYPSDWLRIAEKDLGRVGRNLHDDPEIAGFCLQQAVEKLLKGFMLSRGWKLRKIHDLAALLDDAAGFESTLIKYREAVDRISAFYFVDRYPFSGQFTINDNDVAESLRRVTDLIDYLRDNIS